MTKDANQRIRSPDSKQKDHGNGYCPKCGSGWVVKRGLTTNAGAQKQSYMCKSCGFRPTSPYEKPPAPKVSMRDSLPKTKRYLITSAQNATPVHKGFWAAFNHCATYYNAERVVIPGRYKNPTSQWTQKNQEHEWWSPAVVPYLCYGRISLNDRLMIVGDAKIAWASSKPLAGLDALTKDMSGVIGHGSRALRSIATPQYKHPKLMFTTGACTVPNYTDTKTGLLGEFHHCLGALIVEIDAHAGNAFYIRQLDATRDGSFIDLDMEFTPHGVRKAKRALALAVGDLHYRWARKDVLDATLSGSESLVGVTNPKHLFWHDVLDFHARNHHHEGNLPVEYGKWKYGIENVQVEMNEVIDFLNKSTPRGRYSLVVASNHDKAANRWLNRANSNTDHVNGNFIDECKIRMRASVRKGLGGIDYDDVFTSYARTRAKPNVIYLTERDRKTIQRVEYAYHGDKGPGGSRGSTTNLSKMGVKVTKGHDHTAAIIDACYSVGKCTDTLEYEGGAPSAHTNSHVLQYANGKRTVITIINGRFCLKRPNK